MNLPFLHKTFCSVRCHCSTYWQSFKLDVLSAALASPLTFRPILSPLSCKPCDLVVRLLNIRHLALVIAKQPASLTHVACSDLSWLECMIDDFASNSNPFHVVCSSMFLCSSTTTYVASCLAAKLHNDFCAALVYNRRRV